MKLKNIVSITLLLVVLTITRGAVTASQDNVTADELNLSEDIISEDSLKVMNTITFPKKLK